MDSSAFFAATRLAGRKEPLPAVYGKLHGILRGLMPAENFFVALCAPHDMMRFPYYADQIQPENPLRIYKREGMTEHVLEAGETVWVRRDPSVLERVSFVGPPPADWIGVLLRDRAGAVIGVMAVQTYEPGERYTEEQASFVEYAAIQLSMAIQFHWNDRDRAIARIAALVDESVDVREIYAGIHAIAVELIPAAARNFIIARVDRKAGMFQTVYWLDEKDDFNKIQWPLSRGFSGYILAHTRESFVYDKATMAIPREVNPIGTPPYRWLGAPLFGAEGISGVVIIQSYDEGTSITREDEETLNCLCPHIAAAIERTEFFEKTRLDVLSRRP